MIRRLENPGVHPLDQVEDDPTAAGGDHVLQFFKVPATARASFSIYNTESEVDALFAALKKAQEIFG